MKMMIDGDDDDDDEMFLKSWENFTVTYKAAFRKNFELSLSLRVSLSSLRVSLSLSLMMVVLSHFDGDSLITIFIEALPSAKLQ